MTVAIATTGRPQIVARTLVHLAALADRPAHVIVSVAGPDDLDLSGLPHLPFALEVLTGPKGSSVQRNAVLDATDAAGVVLFLDDDFLIADGYLAAVGRLFRDHPDVVMATGRVLADGIHGPGLDHEAGLAVLAAHRPEAAPPPQDVYSVYGCNMAIRNTGPDARFDEALPLYAWLEDLDLSRRMARTGRIVRDERLVGVHLGTKVGRSRGLPLGYSQIANPVYLMRKGTMHPRRALTMMTRNILANAGKALWPEPQIDRRGRLRGNLRALADLLRGRLLPDRILRL